jgi:ribosomal protein L29
MKASELRNKSVEDLKKELLSLARANFELKMQLAAKQLSKTSEIRKTKKDIARVKTILAEKEVQA